MPSFGRIPEYDERNRNYPVRELVAAQELRSYTWPCPLNLDQQQTPSCVAHAIAHEIAAKPVQPLIPPTEAWALDLYHQAQAIDNIPGPHEGTSVLAGMKAATQRGFYTQYRWAYTVDDLALAVGHHGPAVIGINWTAGMMKPTPAGYIIPTGDIVGGHAILVRGVHVGKNPYFLLRNSWGTAWGINGEARISHSDLNTLLKQDGDACIPVAREKGTS